MVLGGFRWLILGGFRSFLVLVLTLIGGRDLLIKHSSLYLIYYPLFLLMVLENVKTER